MARRKDLVRDYLAFIRANRAPATLSQYRAAVNSADRFLRERGTSLDLATYRDLQRVVEAWETVHAPSVKNIKTQALHVMGTWAVEHGYWPVNAAAKLHWSRRKPPVNPMDLEKWAARVAMRLRARRHTLGLTMDNIAGELGVTAGEISRIEVNKRGCGLGRLKPWATALGCNVAVVTWPAEPDTTDWDEEQLLPILEEVAAALRRMPEPAKLALIREMRSWREAAEKG